MPFQPANPADSPPKPATDEAGLDYVDDHDDAGDVALRELEVTVVVPVRLSIDDLADEPSLLRRWRGAIASRATIFWYKFAQWVYRPWTTRLASVLALRTALSRPLICYGVEHYLANLRRTGRWTYAAAELNDPHLIRARRRFFEDAIERLLFADGWREQLQREEPTRVDRGLTAILTADAFDGNEPAFTPHVPVHHLVHTEVSPTMPRAGVITAARGPLQGARLPVQFTRMSLTMFEQGLGFASLTLSTVDRLPFEQSPGVLEALQQTDTLMIEGDVAPLALSPINDVRGPAADTDADTDTDRSAAPITLSALVARAVSLPRSWRIEAEPTEQESTRAGVVFAEATVAWSRARLRAPALRLRTVNRNEAYLLAHGVLTETDPDDVDEAETASVKTEPHGTARLDSVAGFVQSFDLPKPAPLSSSAAPASGEQHAGGSGVDDENTGPTGDEPPERSSERRPRKRAKLFGLFARRQDPESVRSRRVDTRRAMRVDADGDAATPRSAPLVEVLDNTRDNTPADGSERGFAAASERQPPSRDPRETGRADAVDEGFDPEREREQRNDERLIHFIHGRGLRKRYAPHFVQKEFNAKIVEIESDAPIGCSEAVLASLEFADDDGESDDGDARAAADNASSPATDARAPTDSAELTSQGDDRRERRERRWLWHHLYLVCLYLSLEYHHLLELISRADPYRIFGQNRLYERVLTRVRYLQRRYVFPSVAREPVAREVWQRLEAVLSTASYRATLRDAVTSLEESLFRTRVYVLMSRAMRFVWLLLRIFIVPLIVVKLLIVISGSAIYALVVVPLALLALVAFAFGRRKIKHRPREVRAAIAIGAAVVMLLVSLITWGVLVLTNTSFAQLLHLDPVDDHPLQGVLNPDNDAAGNNDDGKRNNNRNGANRGNSDSSETESPNDGNDRSD